MALYQVLRYLCVSTRLTMGANIPERQARPTWQAGLQGYTLKMERYFRDWGLSRRYGHHLTRRSMSAHVWGKWPQTRSAPAHSEIVTQLVRDARTVQGDPSFKEWCAAQGEDTKNPDARMAYNHCKTTARKLKQFFGDRMDAVEREVA